MNRLDQFLDYDDKARDRVAAISAAAGFLCFLGMRLIFRIDPTAAGYWTLAATTCVYGAKVWAYCSAPKITIGPITQPVSVTRRFVMAAAAISVAVLVNIFPASKVEAALFDRRFLRLTRNPDLSPREAEEVKNSLIRALERGVLLPSTTQKLVRDAVKTSALQDPRPPFTDAATAFVKYMREVPTPKNTGAPTEAEIAMDAAARYTIPLLRSSIRSFPLLPSRAEIEMAISLLTRAIELAGSNSKVKSDALLSRAYFYNELSEPNEALADLEASQKLGFADLAEIISIEGDALLDRGVVQGRPEDLKRAVELLGLELQLPPPMVIADDQQIVFLSRIDALTERARAHYLLQQYTEAIEDSKQLVTRLGQASLFSEEAMQTYLQRAYLLTIGSHLHRGELAEATRAASEWERKSNGRPAAVSLRQAIESQSFNAQSALNDFDRFIYHP